jgi:RimJ/RimL family protein N-acetyltransferase
VLKRDADEVDGDPIRPLASSANTPAFLLGERIALRPLTSADVDGPYLDWFNDPEVCRLNSHHVFPYTRAEALAWVDGLAGRRDTLVLAITMREDDRHVGNVSLQGIDAVSRTAELAIVLGDRSVWGQGIGLEAARLLVAHGFGALNLHRIACGTLAANVAMRRLAERLGMREEGVRRDAAWTDGSYHDIVEYGLLAAEWEG